ncbi:unnamed protein product [Acanthoscelides obtectus]|uniref:Uncharacterized protein n=1 Tax=Acanthoscelides obtectus TaxID=200917 RepID=A0A9P0KTJ1_ACAOB|nr:unnamed protein product [Acanthoscelides obtectus]CAK1622126.1 hypothetical protein AOBTE_LOCUS1324 [Acanthoscelides obtectus]
MEDELLGSGSKKNGFSQFCTRVSQWYQGLVDRTVPWQKCRWFAAVLLLLGFMARILYAQVLLHHYLWDLRSTLMLLMWKYQCWKK